MLFDESHRAPQARVPRIEPFSIGWLERLFTSVGVWGLAAVVGGVLGCCALWLVSQVAGGEDTASLGTLLGELAGMWPLIPLLHAISPFAVVHLGQAAELELRLVAFLFALALLVEWVTWLLYVLNGKWLRAFAVAVAVASLGLPVSVGLVFS